MKTKKPKSLNESYNQVIGLSPFKEMNLEQGRKYVQSRIQDINKVLGIKTTNRSKKSKIN